MKPGRDWGQCAAVLTMVGLCAGLWYLLYLGVMYLRPLSRLWP